MINVLTIDDHDIVREGIKKILGQTNDIRVVQEAENPRGILNHSLKNSSMNKKQLLTSSQKSK